MVAPPGPTAARYRLFETVLPKSQQSAETSLFEGIDVSLAGLRATPVSVRRRRSRRLLPRSHRVSTPPLGRSRAAAPRRRCRISSRPDGAARSPGPNRSDGIERQRQYEIEPRLRLKEQQLQDAIACSGCEDRRDRQRWARRARSTPERHNRRRESWGRRTGVARLTMLGFDGPGNCAPGVATVSAPYYCEAELTAPSNARLTDVYWQRPENAGRATFDEDARSGCRSGRVHSARVSTWISRARASFASFLCSIATKGLGWSAKSAWS